MPVLSGVPFFYQDKYRRHEEIILYGFTEKVRVMIQKKWFGILFCLLLVATMIIAGCSSDSGDMSTPVPTTAPVAKYVAGDIVAMTDSSSAQQLYVITNYDSATDEYTRAWIYRNSDGSWGHFIDSKTEKSPRTLVEKAYPFKIDHVTISSVPVITPTIPVAANVTYIGSGPTLNNITPNTGVIGGSATVTITGNNFQTGAIAKLVQAGSGSVTGTATSVSTTTISTTFNLNQMTSGSCDVLVINPDGRSDILPSAFTIGDAMPVVTSISPNTAAMNDTVDSFTINGQNFLTSGVTVSFVMGSSTIPCSSAESISASTITCGPVEFTSTNNAQTGLWDIRVLNIEDQMSGTGSQLFTITNSTST